MQRLQTKPERLAKVDLVSDSPVETKRIYSVRFGLIV